jgi:RNA recognition motif-containing protein
MNKQIDSQMLTYAAEILSNGGLDYLFGGQPKKVKPVNPYEGLNDGFELRPIELTEEESKNKRIVDMKYSHLYKDDIRVSDDIFRKGGLCHGFKEGYCDLIHYIRTNESKKNDNGFSFGESVIINTDGKICLTREGLDYAYHLGGNIASMGNYYYNLLTGEKICYKPSSVIKGEEYLYLEHRYNFGYYEVKIPVGVYKLNKITLELTKIDEIK